MVTAFITAQNTRATNAIKMRKGNINGRMLNTYMFTLYAVLPTEMAMIGYFFQYK